MKLAPHISISRTLRSTDITMVALDAAYQSVALVKWKDKEHAKVFWRGSPTGVSHRKHLEWRKSQRHRLNRFANNASNDAIPVLVERGNTVRAEAHRIRDMNQRWFDIGLTGGPTQCSIEDGSCDELQKEVEWKNPVRGAGSLA